MDLPVQFLERMKAFLGEEYEEFLASYDQPRKFGLRVNTLKISVEEFVRLAPFHLTPIPWVSNGFYYEREDAPARHPFYNAGLYYLQEPSAMTPADILPVVPGEHVLDLCAAPGGKATALAAKLQGQGLLVANEISASRAKALLKNMEIFGVKNSFISNAAPYTLAEQFGEAFDKILVDAPCSGEGMFRKDIANARVWSLDKVESCAKIQREITRQAVKMLRPGGLLLYSTCTFSPEENEGTIAYLLETCPELELLELPAYEGFLPGMPTLLDRMEHGSETCRALRENGVFSDENQEKGKWEQLRRCVRIFPHKMGGEGHFLALLKKEGELPGLHHRAARRRGKPSKEEEKVLQEFLGDVSFRPDEGASDAGRAADRQKQQWLMEQTEVRSGQVYFVQEPLQIRGGIPFLRNGLYLGELKKNRFEPSQSFAMVLAGSQYASVIQLDWKDERVRKYLCGETIAVDDLAPARARGWQLVCVNGYPLGWGKLAGGNLKNKLHPGWRI